MKNEDTSLISEWHDFVKDEDFNLIEKCLKLAKMLELSLIHI